jgi:ethanolamine kinase
MSGHHVDHYIDINEPEIELHKKVIGISKEIVKSTFPKWSDAKEEEFTLKKISGGITNLLIKVAHGEEAVLVRIFGEKTDLIIDRTIENQTFKTLSDRKFGPLFYGTFTNGRIEGWLDAVPLEPHEMGLIEPVNFVSLIAKQVAKLHQLDMPKLSPEPSLWPSLEKWYAMVLASPLDVHSPNAKIARVSNILAPLNLHEIRKELDWLKSVLPSSANDYGKQLLEKLAVSSKNSANNLPCQISPFKKIQSLCSYPLPSSNNPEEQAKIDATAFMYRQVYAHNDLLSGNIMHREGPVDYVTLIDYEYAGFNFLGHELANHFCEHAGFDFDIEKWYPSKKVQCIFFQTYMESMKELSYVPNLSSYDPAAPPSTSPDAISEVFLSTMFEVANAFTLTSDFWWGIWAIVQAQNSPIDFDFASYSIIRMKAYMKHKRDFYSLEANLITETN